MIGLYLAQSAKLIPEIHATAERRDGNALERSAHKLKGSMSIFAAGRATEVAQRLETMGRVGDFSHAAEALADRELELGRLLDALTAFTGEDAECFT